VREVPNGVHIEERDADMLLTHADGRQSTMPYCDTKNGARPAFLEHVPGPLPPDYDGWEEYTSVENSDGYDTFLGYFSVPDKPAADPQVLYLFTGLQNINWIPKATPLPTTPFDIIQPVLQYPASFGNEWSVKSWWVTLNGGAMFSTELPVNSGDKIFGNMTRVGSQSYYIGSVIASSGKVTGITYTNSRLQSQPWAYNTLECYGCQDCSTYPTQPSYFTDLQLFITKDTPAHINWVPNQFPAKDRKCHEGVDIVNDATVTIEFNTQGQQ